MAYSDYGGYAYKNGEHIYARSDFTVTPDGGFESPGMFPGFGAIAAGKSVEEAKQIRTYPNGHAVLGDGPIFVTLYKQSHTAVYNGLEEVAAFSPYDRERDYEWIEGPQTLEIDGHKITVHYLNEENAYQFVRLEQPNGDVWHGWSGYGVGAGLEDCGYGFSTQLQCDRLVEIWPDAIAA